jgi:hypothetical protein
MLNSRLRRHIGSYALIRDIAGGVVFAQRRTFEEMGCSSATHPSGLTLAAEKYYGEVNADERGGVLRHTPPCYTKATLETCAPIHD